MQTYGYDKIFTLNNLEKVGLLRKQEARNTYPALRKVRRLPRALGRYLKAVLNRHITPHVDPRRQTLRLFVDDINEREPNDIAYVYSGYAPLSVRLVQAAASKNGWKPLEEFLKLLPGPTFDDVQPLPQGLQPKRTARGDIAAHCFLCLF